MSSLCEFPLWVLSVGSLGEFPLWVPSVGSKTNKFDGSQAESRQILSFFLDNGVLVLMLPGTHRENPQREPTEGTHRGNSQRELTEGTHRENSPREPTEGTHHENPQRELTRRTHRGNSPREPTEGTHRGNPQRELTEGTHRGNSHRELTEGTHRGNSAGWHARQKSRSARVLTHGLVVYLRSPGQRKPPTDPWGSPGEALAELWEP